MPGRAHRDGHGPPAHADLERLLLGQLVGGVTNGAGLVPEHADDARLFGRLHRLIICGRGSFHRAGAPAHRGTAGAVVGWGAARGSVGAGAGWVPAPACLAGVRNRSSDLATVCDTPHSSGTPTTIHAIATAALGVSRRAGAVPPPPPAGFTPGPL